ncbi:aminoglycoside phosphotransferase family protein [Jannaschia sp. R86511]|uniref:aminoglycoside phosphotransferase family protein n=1 Tax=Jannaschia sp. R86511 TaxID=3093853 RepID=UPI0036D2C2A5
MSEHRPRIDEQLVRRLVASQLPRWSHLPVAAVAVGGVDNRTFRLGGAMSVRLPSAEGYRLQVDKEQQWLPRLAPHLPLAVPEPLALGHPGHGYPFRWSVRRWIDGERADRARVADQVDLATSLADFLVALRGVDATDGPGPGPHNFHRGGPLATYEAEALRSVDRVGHLLPRDRVLRVWEHARAARWDGAPVWFHGDVAAGNLLLRRGRLHAVIDFGTSGVGDPACDVVVAWTLLDGPARDAFRARYDVDAATWSRGRGWALWKAALVLAEHVEDGSGPQAPAARDARTVIGRVVADFEAEHD